MTSSQQRDRTLSQGLTYADFRAQWDERLAAPTAGLTPDARKMRHYVKYNRDRSASVHAAYTPSERLRRAVAALPEPLTVLVITEDWCGDSAFELPVIADALDGAQNATLRILPRDQHLDVMDEHLTNGARSIPKLVAFGPDGETRFTWGPRPATGSAHRQTLVDQGLDKNAVIAGMVKWNEAGGWMAVDDELATLLEAQAR